MKRLVILLAAAGILTGTVAVAQEPAGVPEEAVKELAYLVGTWKFEGNFGETELDGTVTYQWTKGKKYGIVEDWMTNINGQPTPGVGMTGWHAVYKCLVKSGFNAAGANFSAHWVVKSDTQWKSEFTNVLGGEKVEGRGVLVKKGPAEFVYEAETTEGDTARIVFRKVASSRAKAR